MYAYELQYRRYQLMNIRRKSWLSCMFIFYYMSIEIYVKYSGEIKFVFHYILYFSHVKKVVSALWLVVRYFFTVKKVVWAFWLADIFLPKKFNTCSQANVNMESDFVNLLRREIYDILSTKNLERSWRNTFVVSLRWNKPHGCIFCTKTNRQMVRNFVFIFRLYFVVRQYIKYLVSLYSSLYSYNKQITSWLVRLYDFYYSLVVKDR